MVRFAVAPCGSHPAKCLGLDMWRGGSSGHVTELCFTPRFLHTPQSSEMRDSGIEACVGSRRKQQGSGGNGAGEVLGVREENGDRWGDGADPGFTVPTPCNLRLRLLPQVHFFSLDFGVTMAGQCNTTKERGFPLWLRGRVLLTFLYQIIVLRHETGAPQPLLRGVTLLPSWREAL